jgi:hypothetical protein
MSDIMLFMLSFELERRSLKPGRLGEPTDRDSAFPFTDQPRRSSFGLEQRNYN